MKNVQNLGIFQCFSQERKKVRKPWKAIGFCYFSIQTIKKPRETYVFSLEASSIKVPIWRLPFKNLKNLFLRFLDDKCQKPKDCQVFGQDRPTSRNCRPLVRWAQGQSWKLVFCIIIYILLIKQEQKLTELNTPCLFFNSLNYVLGFFDLLTKAIQRNSTRSKVGNLTAAVELCFKSGKMAEVCNGSHWMVWLRHVETCCTCRYL